MSDAEQLAAVFKADKRFHRILDLLLEKYESYGEHKGKITLKDATAGECEALNSFIAPRIFYKPPVLSFRVKEFEVAIKDSRYSSASLKAVLEAYYDKTLFTSVEKKQIRLTKYEAFEKRNLDKYKEMPCSEWLEHMFRKKCCGYAVVINEYKSNSCGCEKLLENVCRAVNERFDSDFDPIQLAVLGANITGDSHYFDSDNTSGKLLLSAIAFYAEAESIKNASDRQSLYDFFHIETNPIFAAAAVLQIRFFDGEGKEHPGFAKFADMKEPALISDINIRKMERAESADRIIYAVENPSVFSVLVNYMADTDSGLICTFGQIKTVGKRLTDMLINGGCTIYYAGDFDPEGMQIADKLLSRYPLGKVVPWRMSLKDYKGVQKSNDIISQKRLNILKKIKSELLLEVARSIEKEKRAAYQELLIDKMIRDILKN